MSIQIREASKEEVDIVYSTMREAFEEYNGKLNPPSGALRETSQDIMDNFNHGGSVIAWDHETAAGSARYKFTDNYIYIGRVAVIPQYRGSGVCRSILNYIEEKAATMNLLESKVEVRLSIPENIEMYKRFNYEIVEQLFYPDETDSWYVMIKKLQK